MLVIDRLVEDAGRFIRPPFDARDNRVRHIPSHLLSVLADSRGDGDQIGLWLALYIGQLDEDKVRFRPSVGRHIDRIDHFDRLDVAPFPSEPPA